MKSGMSVKGMKEVLRNLDKANKGIRDGLAAAVYQEALATIGEAKKRTPVDTNRLRGSGYAGPPVITRRGPTSTLGFGVKYGWWVHENLSAFHVVGGPKFLESVLNERRRGYARRMAKRTWNNYKAGIGVEAIPASQPTGPTP